MFRIMSNILVRFKDTIERCILISFVLLYAQANFFAMISAQTTCNQGIGRVVYERLPDQQLQGFDDDVVSSLH